jgi:tetratricopeptide (TPR) repeat protein
MKCLVSSIGIMLALSSLPGLGLEGTAWSAENKKDERRVLKLSDVGTETKSDFYRQKARQKRGESRKMLEDMLRKNKAKGETKAVMLLRLAENYMEEGQDIFRNEMETFQGEFDACFNSPNCDTEKMVADNDGSKRWRLKAIKIYQAILKGFPQFRRADEASFYLAIALQETGKPDDAAKRLARMVQDYPQSSNTPDAYVLLGEYYFDNNNAYKALQAYKSATEHKNSSKYGFAMYKLAWCYYNVGEYGTAIDTMKSVVQYSMTGNEGQGGKRKLTLQEEALKDLVRFFADAGEMEEAYTYFNKLGKKELIRSMLKRLASTYFEQGKFDQCIRTYRRLISEDSNSANAPEYQNEIILAYQKTGQKRETRKEIKQLLETYGKNSDSGWVRANSADLDAVKEAQGYIEKNLRTVALNYHNDAKKLGKGTEAKDSYKLAGWGYATYLKEFPDNKHSYEMRYAYGELLYDLKMYAKAYDQYMKVVAMDRNGKHTKFCAEAAIFASEQMTKQEGAGSKPASKTEEAPLTDWETKLIAACDQWQNLFPDHKNTRKIIFKSARLLYGKNHFKAASDRFRVVIGMNPKSNEAIEAANLILDSFVLVEDWQNLKEVSKAFRDQEGLGSKAFKTEVAAIYQNASFKLIQLDLEKNQNKAQAADSFMGFYGEFPDSKVADVALNNAAVYYHETGASQKAMASREVLVEKFPKSKYYNDNIAALGFDYEGIADFEKAADYYEQLFKLDPTHQGAKEAIYSAGLFRTALGDTKAGVLNYSSFIKTFPDDGRVNGLRIGIADTFRKSDKHAEAAKLYQAFYTNSDGKSADQIFYAKLQYGLQLEAIGQNSKATPHWQQMVKDYKASKEAGVEMEAATEFAARVMLKLARPQLESTLALKIDGPKSKVNAKKEGEVLKAQLIAKAKAVQAIEARYIEIVKTGAGEYGVAALVDLGKLYENLAESLRTSYVPPSLNEEQREFYADSLEDKAFPNDEKATQAYTQALQTSYRLNLYTDNTAYAVRRLGELRPADYPGLNEDMLTPRYTSKAVVESTFEPAL